jgi:hypothetical protein
VGSPEFKHQIPPKKILIQVPVGWLTPVILATWEVQIRRIVVRSQPGQIALEILFGKHPNMKKRAGGVAQVVECLPSKKALSSNPPFPQFFYTSFLACMFSQAQKCFAPGPITAALLV